MGQGAVVDADHTLQMAVADIGFMLDRLGRDCSPLQFLRELTQNSLDAIARTGTGSGTIIWDVDWAYLDLTGVYKLCIIDDGVGMTGQEMVRYINNLSASVHTQSHSGNFGVGAKIAAATRNHAGLVYLSWINNIGHTIHLWRSPVTNQYGLQRYTLPDGTVTSTTPSSRPRSSPSMGPRWCSWVTTTTMTRSAPPRARPARRAGSSASSTRDISASPTAWWSKRARDGSTHDPMARGTFSGR